MPERAGAQNTLFRLEEATIDDMHAAIRAGETTRVQIVQHYIDRARAFNGVASALVTEDGAPVPQATGAVRAGAPLSFPTETVKASARSARCFQRAIFRACSTIVLSRGSAGFGVGPRFFGAPANSPRSRAAPDRQVGGV